MLSALRSHVGRPVVHVFHMAAMALGVPVLEPIVRTPELPLGLVER